VYHLRIKQHNVSHVQKLGKLFLQSWFKLWKLRNDERHGKDAAEQKAKRGAFLRSQLQELYDSRDRMLPAHRSIFLTDVDTHLTQRPNLDGLEDWIDMFRPAVQSSIKQATARAMVATMAAENH
jgi:hypothetical protein